MKDSKVLRSILGGSPYLGKLPYRDVSSFGFRVHGT